MIRPGGAWLAAGLVFASQWILHSDSCMAAVPRTIHYQGKLTEPDGTSLVGEHTVTLRLYDAATGGTELWEEEHTLNLARSDNGIFSVILGSRQPFGEAITFNDPLWLTTEVDGGGEFSPRQPLSSVSYAINADTLDGLDSGELMASVNLEDLAITSAQVADGTLTAADTSSGFLSAGSGVAVTKGPASWLISSTGTTGGTITGVSAGVGLTGGGSAGDVTLDIGPGTGMIGGADTISVDVGTGSNQIVQLDGTGALPAVSGANLTSLSGASLSDDSVTATKLAADSVGPAALASNAITSGDIEAGDLPPHASTHQPGGTDALPTAAAVSIGSANGAGTSTSLSRADHAHQGLHSIAASGQPQLFADATLAPGANISLTQTGQTITVAALSGGRATNVASAAVAIGTASDTTLASAMITKVQAGSVLLVIATVQLQHSVNPNSKTVDLKLFRDAAQLDANYTARIGTANEAVRDLPVTLHSYDTPAAGTYTFTLRARASAAGAQATIRRLTVLEIP